MENMSVYVDAMHCMMWILTYTFIFLGILKCRFPLLPPSTWVVIAPFEFAVLYKFIISDQLNWKYISLSYIYWSIIEIAIIIAIFKTGYMKKNFIPMYILIVVLITNLMCYLVIYKDKMFFFAYFNTFIGELFWLKHIIKKDYPVEPLALAAFVAKFIGDTLAVLVYFGNGPLLIDMISILLPMIDFVFIVIYLQKKEDIENERV